MKKRNWLIIAVVSCFFLIGCSKEDGLTVGITQIIEHPSLDEAKKGFKQAFTDAKLEVTFDEQVAQGDQNNAVLIASNFVADKVDLIFANSTPSALTAYNATNDIPILFTSVSDPVGAGLVDAAGYGTNISGTTDLHPEAITQTIAFIEKYFPKSKVGLIYNAGEQNSVTQINLVKESIQATSLSIVEATVATSADVKQAADSIVDKIDVFYIVTDNTVVSGIASVIQASQDKKKPLFVGELDSVRSGGFAAYGFEYYDIGYQAGQMAVSILKGERKVSELPMEYPKQLTLVINKEASEKMGITWKKEWENEGIVLK